MSRDTHSEHRIGESFTTEDEMVREALGTWPPSRVDYLILKTGLRRDEIEGALVDLEDSREAPISDEVVDFVLEPLTARHVLAGQDYADVRDALRMVLR